MADLVNTLLRIRESERELGAHETATRQGAVLPILADLGWNPYDLTEVIPEFVLAGRRVDYCLRIAKQNSVFVEVKRTTEELVGHQRQLLEYAFEQGVPLAVLTNGLQWWLYLPTESGPWEERKFFSIDLREQSLDQASSAFQQFLAKDIVQSGLAISDAKQLREGYKRTQVIAGALPEAWEKLIGEPDELLLELLIERTESMCGHRPDSQSVAAFLSAIYDSSVRPGFRPQPKPVPASSPRHAHRGTVPPLAHQPAKSTPSFMGLKPTSVSLYGRTFPATSWKGVLLTVCEVVREKHPKEFNRVLSLRGRSRSYFSTDPGQLFKSAEVPGSNIHAETNLSANDIARRCQEVLELVGDDPATLQITAV